MIKVKLSLRSGLKKIIKQNDINLILSEDSDFNDLAVKLCEEYGADVKKVLFSEKYGFIWLCIRNRRKVLPDEILEDGDNVILLPPLAGG